MSPPLQNVPSVTGFCIIMFRGPRKLFSSFILINILIYFHFALFKTQKNTSKYIIIVLCNGGDIVQKLKKLLNKSVYYLSSTKKT